ncbi:MAG: 4Fe-4S binding protein [Candidatus Bathyarchaeales archaeon]
MNALNATASKITLNNATQNMANPLSNGQNYSVTFTKSGLRSGIVWTVVLDSQYFSSYADSITCYVPEGVHSFNIPEVGGWPTGYDPSPQSGSVTVKGENVTVQVIFTPSTLKFPSIMDLSLFIIISMPLVASIAIIFVVRRRKKSIRYLRWASKAAFLLLYLVPVAYLAGTPLRGVYSLFFGIQVGKPWLLVPIGQSVCITFTTYSIQNINPGAWLMCPIGAITTLLTGLVDELRIIPTIIAMLAFLIPIFLLGNVFCSWACPLGTIIDSFDKFIEKFYHKIEAKRNARYAQNKQNKSSNLGSRLLCPACPISKIMSKKNGVVAYGILGTTLLTSYVFSLSVFCLVCPMGIISRGLVHLKSLSMRLPTARVTGQYLAIVPELFLIPVVAVIASIRERRFWCRKLCPLGAVLNGAGALNPFIKPKVEKEKCVMKGCPSGCEEYHKDYCAICRYEDDRRCEKVCPVGIKLVDDGSLHKCTKCMECYIVCEYDAVKVDLVGKPDIFRIGSFFKRLKTRRQKEG